MNEGVKAFSRLDCPPAARILPTASFAAHPGGKCGPAFSLAGLVLWLAAATPLPAQIPAPVQDRPIALVGATVHTVSGAVVDNGTVVFDRGRITAVGPNVPVPSNARRIDVRGKHVYPGLIHSLTGIGLFEVGAVAVTVDLNEQGRINPNVRAQVAFHPESEHIPVARSAGVLTAVSSPSGGLISGLSAAMMMDGWTWERMAIKAPVALIINWPQAGAPAPGPPAARPREESYNEELGELRGAFARARAYKIAKEAEARGGPYHETDSRWEAMIPVLNGEIPMLVHADDLVQIQDALTFAERENVRLILAGGRDSWRIADQLKHKDVPVLVTNVLSSPSRPWEAYDGVYSLPARLHRAGVRFAIAGESAAQYANRLPYHAGAAAAFELPKEEALKAVTLYPAQILGLAHRLGSIEVGKDATLMVTGGDPLEYSTIVEQVYIQGRTVDMTDKHRRLFERYREKYRQVAEEQK